MRGLSRTRRGELSERSDSERCMQVEIEAREDASRQLAGGLLRCCSFRKQIQDDLEPPVRLIADLHRHAT
jgi:hypothetical protein